MFKYLYYRYYQHYIKGKESDKTARFSAVIALSTTHLFMVLCTILTTGLFIDTSSFRENYSWLIAPLFLATAFFLSYSIIKDIRPKPRASKNGIKTLQSTNG